ncbi:MAG: class I tRNA ligase family protein, partial [Fimbriimonadaceae bacterium]
HLLHVSDFSHSYPHSERDGKPVIFRATEQWFVSLDHNDLRKTALAEINKVSWRPESGKTRISSMIENRPDWCISRQRPWGVGIPIFYGKDSREPVLDAVAIEAVAKLVESEGSDAWFEREPSEILPQGYKHPVTGETEFSKETDVLDVWFDSGSTSLAVFEGNVESVWKDELPVELYLEGSDQHRGWFNSSLIIGVGTRGKAPYKEVVTHGFVVDANGLKMSKRLGNVIDPLDVCNQYGADVLRYWVASVDWANDVPCYDALLKQFGEQYRTVRNTLKFLHQNLYDFADPDVAICNDLDQWIIEQTELLVADCAAAYLDYDYRKVIEGVHNFCAKELSKIYADGIKDRMYCDGADWDSRRSGQKACHTVLVAITKLIAPILPHSAEEIYGRIPAYKQLDSVHLETIVPPTPERLAEIAENAVQRKVSALIAERADCYAAFEVWKTANEVKDSQDVIATVVNSADQLAPLREFDQNELAILYKMSWVELVEGKESFSFRLSEYPKCERSRVRRPDVK